MMFAARVLGQESDAAGAWVLIQVAGVDLVLREDVAREVAMRLRHARQHGLGRVVIVGRQARRRDQIDTVRLAADVFVDPAQLDLERLRVITGRAEHAHAARLRHLDDDVAAVRERDQRKVDSKHLANG